MPGWGRRDGPGVPGAVYASSAHDTQDNSNPVLYAFEARTGHALWQVPIAGTLYEISPGPGNVVYTGSADGVLDAWQADTGNHL